MYTQPLFVPDFLFSVGWFSGQRYLSLYFCLCCSAVFIPDAFYPLEPCLLISYFGALLICTMPHTHAQTFMSAMDRTMLALLSPFVSGSPTHLHVLPPPPPLLPEHVTDPRALHFPRILSSPL